MMMRKHQVEGAYEKLKEVTRGQDVGEEKMTAFVQSLNIPQDDKKILANLKPWNYVGLAGELTRMLDDLE